MKVKCPGCSADFAVDDNRIPPQGLQVRCPKCFKAIEVKQPASGLDADLERELGIDLPPMKTPPVDVPPPVDVTPEELSANETLMAIPNTPRESREPAKEKGPMSGAGTYHQVGGPSDSPMDDVWSGAPKKDKVLVEDPKEAPAPLQSDVQDLDGGLEPDELEWTLGGIFGRSAWIRLRHERLVDVKSRQRTTR